jgi:hypothetical protein
MTGNAFTDYKPQIDWQKVAHQEMKKHARGRPIVVGRVPSLASINTETRRPEDKRQALRRGGI